MEKFEGVGLAMHTVEIVTAEQEMQHWFDHLDLLFRTNITCSNAENQQSTWQYTKKGRGLNDMYLDNQYVYMLE